MTALPVHKEQEHYGSDVWLPAMFLLGLAGFALMFACIPLVTRCERDAMEMLTWLTAVVTVLLLVYLFAALVRPEWF